MTKSVWESRVGSLLRAGGCQYLYKPADGPHGGAVKIDWLGCCRLGHFVMAEVKLATEGRTSFTTSDITPFQQNALNDAAKGASAHVYLAVGQNGYPSASPTLYLWDWRELPWPLPILLPLENAHRIYRYQTLKHLEAEPREWMHDHILPDTARTLQNASEALWQRGQCPSTLKLRGLISGLPTEESGSGSSTLPRRRSSSASPRRGSMPS